MLLPYLSKLNLKKIVLASGSPRRHELLRNQLGLKFDVCVSDFEELLPKHLYTGPEGAARYAVDTARGKVVDVYHKLTRGAGTDMPVTDLTEPRPAWVYPDLIIGADTVVEHAGLILEKPDDDAMATRMLTALSGGVHHVHTGVVLAITVVQGGIPEPEPFIHAFSVTTTVTFDELSDETIQAYIKTGEPFGKAGSYGIQGIAGSFVRQIDGCFFGVVGFPIHRFASEMVALIKEGRLQIDDA